MKRVALGFTSPSAVKGPQIAPVTASACACCSTSSTAASYRSGGYLYFRRLRLTIRRSRARSVSRSDQSMVRFCRRFSVSS